jgi:hypothetical protein
MTFPRTLKFRLQRIFANFGPVAFFTLLLTMGLFKPALAQTAPSLGTAQKLCGARFLNGDQYRPVRNYGRSRLSPGTAVTGFPPGTVDGGSIYASGRCSEAGSGGCDYRLR